MRLAALLFLAPVVGSAQTIVTLQGGPATRPTPAVTAPPEAKPEDLGSLEGQIVNAATGSPVKKAAIMLMRADVVASGPPPSYTTTSDAEGKYAMKGIEPGKYRMTVTRNGFVNATYGARGQFRPGALISLDRAQTIRNVDVRLTPHGVVTGRILDEEGEPVSFANVNVMTFRYVQGKKQLMNTGNATTNDLGEYRIFGIAPGKYYLSATARSNAMMMGPAIERPAVGQPEEDYVPTYYPGTVDMASAALVEVGGGATVSGLNLTLSKARTVHVKGHVTNMVSPQRPVQVMLTPRNSVGFGGPMRSNPVDAAGNFDLRGVTPGSYFAFANLNEDGKMYTARVPVEVGGSNVENVNLTLAPGSDVPGTLRVEGDTTQEFSNTNVYLQPAEAGVINFSGVSPARLKDDRSFVLQNAGSAAFRVLVMGLPDGMYVKAIRAGDLDVLAAGLDLSKGTAPPLEILIGQHAPAVTGSVQDPGTGQPAPGATVVLIPQEKERRDQNTYYRQTATDQRGAYTLKNVPPGEYKVFAWEDLEPGAYMDPEFMKPIEGKGESVSLRESDQKTVTLTLIPAAK
jgi:protocatechuate 3,4-dioxygenase beta subunit